MRDKILIVDDEADIVSMLKDYYPVKIKSRLRQKFRHWRRQKAQKMLSVTHMYWNFLD